MGREGRDAVEIARQEKNRWKKRALRAEATLAKVREWADEHPSTGTLLAILDESPTGRETFADRLERQGIEAMEAQKREDAVAAVVAAWRGVGNGPKIPALSNLGAALDALAEAYGEVVPDDRA